MLYRTLIVNLFIISAFFIFSATSFAGPSEIEGEFGIVLIDVDGPGRWQAFEIEAAYELLKSLPRDIAQIAKNVPGGKARLFKSYKAPGSTETHLAPLTLNFQVKVQLHQASHLATKIASNGLNATEKAQYTLYFKRKILHHLLHMYDAETKVSGSNSWRNISGWRYREYFGIRLPFTKEALNQDPRNYARDEGMDSPAEDFATFGEFYFVDNEMDQERSVKCRIADKFAFFKERFPGFLTFADANRITCQSSDDGFLDDVTFLDPITRRPISMGPFNSDNVEGFELLYATPGVNDAAEIAGHLILRVRLRNNLEAQRLGIENPNDLVISFLADTESDSPSKAPSVATRVDSVPKECRQAWFDFGQAVREDHDAMRSIVQALKGLSGGFLTVYDRQTLYQAIKSYTIDQDRNLLRYKLNLSDAQKKSLIDRLFAAKQNFKSKYYFFDRNCASILVQIIGEGIGAREIAEFDPFVVPPNALVALMIRKGLAQQVFPSFYSYRKKGHIAQEELNLRLGKHGIDQIMSPKEGLRLSSWQSLKTKYVGTSEGAGTFYQLAALGQDAELSYLDRSQRCENYTSKVTEFLRSSQKELLKKYGDSVYADAVDTNVLISEAVRDEESADALSGSQNTQLSSLSLGLSRSDARAQNGVYIGYAVHKQEAGSVTSQSMQRGTSVKLGDIKFEQFKESDLNGDSFRWQLTALEIRKFKERLYEVPSYFSEHGKIGIGLSLLNLRKDSEEDLVHSTLAGGSILFNVISSRLYLDYLFVSIGADFDVNWRGSRTNKLVPDQSAIVLPFRLEGLATFGSARTWQLRGFHNQRLKYIAGDKFFELFSSLSMQYRIPESVLSEFLVSTTAARRVPFADEAPVRKPELYYSIGIEWNRW
jgi:hypothetical protein